MEHFFLFLLFLIGFSQDLPGRVGKKYLLFLIGKLKNIFEKKIFFSHFQNSEIVEIFENFFPKNWSQETNKNFFFLSGSLGCFRKKIEPPLIN